MVSKSVCFPVPGAPSVYGWNPGLRPDRRYHRLPREEVSCYREILPDALQGVGSVVSVGEDGGRQHIFPVRSRSLS